MAQTEINVAVAEATGDNLSTIRRRGFSLFTPFTMFDLDDVSPANPQIAGPHFVNVDAVDDRWTCGRLGLSCIALSLVPAITWLGNAATERRKLHFNANPSC